MSPFLIFAICLNIAYFLYYGANIGKDLYIAGKQPASNEEVFEIEDSPAETAVCVNEQGDGFFVGDNAPKQRRKSRSRRERTEKKKPPKQRNASLRCKRTWTKRM